MMIVFLIYLLGFIIAVRYALTTGCDGRKKINGYELLFVLFLGILSWIGVLALIVGYNAKKNR